MITQKSCSSLNSGHDEVEVIPLHSAESAESSNQAGKQKINSIPCCHRFLYCIYFTVAFLVLVMIISVGTLGTLFINLDQNVELDFESEPWPVKDEEGYYLSYQEGDEWINWWIRNKPSILSVSADFLFSSDDSAIPSPDCVSPIKDCPLDKSLPIIGPYWTNTTSRFVGAAGVRATWLGHSTVLIEIDGSIVLADPIFSERCSPVQWAGMKRFRPPACSVEQLPETVDAVIISHTHYDHLDYNSVLDIHKRYDDKVHWFVPRGSRPWFEDAGIAPDNIHDLVWWESKAMPISGGMYQDPSDAKSARIIFTPNNHLSRRGLSDHNKVLWGSWVVVGRKGHQFWFCGDTGYSDVFKQIGARFGSFDMAAIPIGGYSPRATMIYTHVNPDEAVKIHDDVNSRMSFGIHWGTFVMTYEPYMEPKEKLAELMRENPDKKPFYSINIGETLEAAFAAH